MILRVLRTLTPWLKLVTSLFVMNNGRNSDNNFIGVGLITASLLDLFSPLLELPSPFFFSSSFPSSLSPSSPSTKAKVKTPFCLQCIHDTHFPNQNFNLWFFATMTVILKERTVSSAAELDTTIVANLTKWYFRVTWTWTGPFGGTSSTEKAPCGAQMAF